MYQNSIVVKKIIRLGLVALFCILFCSCSTLHAGGKAVKNEDVTEKMIHAKVIELNFLWHQNAPLLGFNPPYRQAMLNTHQQTLEWIPGLSFAADMQYFSGQHGSPNLDAIGHILVEIGNTFDNGRLHR